MTYRRADGSAASRPRLGRDQRVARRSETTPQVRFRWDYAGGWGKYRNVQVLERLQEPLRGVRRAGAPDARRGVQGAERQLLDGSGMAARSRSSASTPWLPDQTNWELHLSHFSGELPKLEAFAELDVRRRAGRGSSGATLPRQADLRLRLERQGRPRRTSTAATSTSTRSTRHTGRAGSVSRETHAQRHRRRSATASSRSARSPGYPSQEMRPAAPGERYRVTVGGPGVMPVMQVEVVGLDPCGSQA